MIVYKEERIKREREKDDALLTLSCTPLARGENHLVSFNRMAATFLAA